MKKKAIKLALAASLLTIPANAYAMPEEVPSVWTSLMQRTWAIIAFHRPCGNKVTRVCDGQL